MIMGHKLTTEEFIERAKVFHPEYDYSKVVILYINLEAKLSCKSSRKEINMQLIIALHRELS